MPAFPGPASRALLDELARYVIAEPYPFALDLEASSGMWLATVDGQRLFDWMGHYGSKLIGHNHPALAEPEYVKRLVAAANNKVPNPDLLTPECLAYYRLLHDLAPACMRNPRLEVYTLNSGAEAVENMMKYLINLHDRKGPRPGAPKRFLYFDQAFHGRTVFALNVTQLRHDPLVTRNFHGMVPGNIQVPFPALDTDASPAANEAIWRRSLEIVEECLARYRGEVVAILVEPLQGAGGQRVAEPAFFRGLSELAHAHGTFLGFDEVQTAGGQAGKVFAVDLLDVPHPPQAVAVAKKFGCGAVYMLHPMDDHGVLDSTFGGHLADMVRVTQEFRVARDGDLIAQVPAKAARLADGLRALARAHGDLIGNVRGLGLYQGFSLRRPDLKGKLIDLALEKENLLLLGAGTDSIRLRPPLTVTEDEIDLFLAKLGACLETLAGA